MKTFGRSACTRCGDSILPERVPEYISNEHLCDDCAGVTDAQHAAVVKASEKQARVRAEH